MALVQAEANSALAAELARRLGARLGTQQEAPLEFATCEAAGAGAPGEGQRERGRRDASAVVLP